MIEFQPVRMAMDNDGEGCLVLSDGRLAAVAVKLSQGHGELAGRWFVEAAFGRYDKPTHPTFADLDALGAWIAERA